MAQDLEAKARSRLTEINTLLSPLLAEREELEVFLYQPPEFMTQRPMFVG